MPLWAAAALFIACVGAAAIFIKRYGRRKKARFIVFAVLALLVAVVSLVYCGLTFVLLGGVGDTPSEPVIADEAPATLSADPEPVAAADTQTTKAIGGAIAEIDTYIDEAIAAINKARRDDLASATFDYEPKSGYDSLGGKDKAMYDEMLQRARAFVPFSYTAAEHGYDVMDQSLFVYGVLAKDHPEIENYFMPHEVLDEDMITTAIEALYFLPWDAEQNPADTDALLAETGRFDAVCERIVERMPEGLSAYDKYRYLAMVISLATSYDYDSTGGWQVGTAYGSIVGGHSICQGYSRGFLVLCRKANLWCETADGVAGGNDSHMWNFAKLDSGTYHIDVTWCDELGYPGSPEWGGYFMLAQDEILQDHEITDGKTATGIPIN
jgi:hypothetical protein